VDVSKVVENSSKSVEIEVSEEESSDPFSKVVCDESGSVVNNVSSVESFSSANNVESEISDTFVVSFGIPVDSIFVTFEFSETVV